MATYAPRYDASRFGAEVLRFSPRQADVILISSRVCAKMMPILQRVYMQMGCAVKAYNSMKETAKWIANLFENMDEEDRATCAPVFMGMEGMLFGLESLSNQKIAQAIKMEEMVEEERKRVRAARMRLAKVSLDKSKKANEFGVFRLHGSSPNVSIFGDGGILDQMKFLLNEGKQSSGGKG